MCKNLARINGFCYKRHTNVTNFGEASTTIIFMCIDLDFLVIFWDNNHLLQWNCSDLHDKRQDLHTSTDVVTYNTWIEQTLHFEM